MTGQDPMEGTCSHGKRPEEDCDLCAEEATGKIWTPPEALDPNVQRMAWLMFLEAWKAHLVGEHITHACWNAEQMYEICLKNAKIVRLMEQPR